jgi:hypothetical protein
MLSSKKSPRKSELFRSRILAAGRDAALIRDVRRMREFVAGQIAVGILQIGFLVALAYFARALVHLFATHGEALNPWILRWSLAGILVCFLLVARRLFYRLREILEVRGDLRAAGRRFEELREELRRQPRD